MKYMRSAKRIKARKARVGTSNKESVDRPSVSSCEGAAGIPDLRPCEVESNFPMEVCACEFPRGDACDLPRVDRSKFRWEDREFGCPSI